MIYIILFLLILIFSYYYDYLGRTRFREGTYLFILIIFVLLSGFRYRLGVDSIRYEAGFQWVPTLANFNFADLANNSYDPFYFLFSSLVKTLSSEFWVMQLFHAALVNTVVFYFIKKYSKNIFLSILLYYVLQYLNFTFEVMRESCAVSMFLLSWEYFVGRKWLKYYIFCVFAFLFHSSAILLFLLPIFSWFRITNLMIFSKRTIFILFLIPILGYIIQSSFFDYLNIIAFNERIEGKIVAYQESIFAGQIYSMRSVIVTIILYIIYPLIAISSLKKQFHINNLSIEPAVFLCSCFVLLTIPIAIFYRYNNYFSLFFIVLISNFAYSNKIYFSKKVCIKTKSFVLWFIIISPFLFLKIYSYFNNLDDTHLKEYMRYYPYNSIFDKGKNENREALFIYYNAY